MRDGSLPHPHCRHCSFRTSCPTWVWPQRRAKSISLQENSFPKGRPPQKTTAALEVPVLVLGVDGLADHVRRPGAGEEVVVLIRVQFREMKTALAAKMTHIRSHSDTQFCGQLWAECGHGPRGYRRPSRIW